MHTPNSYFDLVLSRYSCRAFLKDVIPRATIGRLLHIARQAPSGANLQPGYVHILTGEPLERFCQALTSTAARQPPEPPGYTYFPDPMPQYLKTRQREAGYALYSALEIGRRDIARRRQQFLANYHFFDAPVGLVISIDRQMGAGCFMDLGMMLMTFMLAAQSLGYATCGIGALSQYANTVHQLLSLPEHQQVVCGIALGRPDLQAAVNQFRTTRIEPAAYSRFYGFNPSAG